VIGAIGVVVMRQPVHSALFLLLSFLAVAGLFVLAHGEFLAAVQILVYAGGIMVLFLFTIMLVNVRRQEREPFIHRQAGVAVLVGLALYALLGGLLVGEVRRLVATDAGAAADPAKLASVVIGGATVAGTARRSAGRSIASTSCRRDRVGLPARRDDRGGRSRQADDGEGGLMVPLSHYLGLSLLLFVLGVVGVLVRRNLLTVLMAIELMLNAVNLN